MDMRIHVALADARPAAAPAQPALSIEGVHKRFDNKFVALQHIDL